MSDLHKVGGVAALIEAGTYLVGMGMLFTVLSPTVGLDPDEHVAFIVDNHVLMHLWILITYLINAVFLVVLVQALYQRLKPGAPLLAQTATAFGLIWAGLVIASGMLTITSFNAVVALYHDSPAQATSAWLALSAVQNGLGGGIELPGGLWLLLISWAGLRTRALPPLLNYCGLVAGGSGLLTVLPSFGDFGAVFGLSAIVWFVWVGIVMLGSRADGIVPGADADVPIDGHKENVSWR